MDPGNEKFAAADLERAERRLLCDLWKVAPLDAVRESGVEMRWFGPLLAVVFSDLPGEPLLNIIHGAGEEGAARRGYLKEAIDWMQEWDVDFLLPVPAEQPGAEEAEAWLNWHGYEQRSISRKYVRPVGGSDADAGEDAGGIEVIELGPGETEGMSLLIAENLELPEASSFLFCGLPEILDWRCYSVHLDEREVGCGAMLVGDGLAVLGFDAVDPEARRRGCHQALLRRRLADAAAAGCRMALTAVYDLPGGGEPAAPPSLARAGFVEAYHSVGWQQPLHSRPADRFWTWS